MCLSSELEFFQQHIVKENEKYENKSRGIFECTLNTALHISVY